MNLYEKLFFRSTFIIIPVCVIQLELSFKFKHWPESLNVTEVCLKVTAPPPQITFAEFCGVRTDGGKGTDRMDFGDRSCPSALTGLS